MISDIKTNARVQKELIKAAAGCLKQGGILIYSTCSLEPEEDELDDEIQELQAEERVEPVGTDLEDKIDWDN